VRQSRSPRTGQKNFQVGVRVLKQSGLAFSLLAAAALSLTPARADDIKPFAGPYFGLHGGYSWQDVGGVFDSNTSATSLGGINLNGGIVGAQLGYNTQYDWFLVGVEGDATALTGSGGSVTGPNGEVLNGDVDYLATIRGRLGYVVNDVMLYGTAGVAFAEFKLTENATGGPFTLRARETGAVYGGGLEWQLVYGVTVRGEYLHYDLATNKFIPPNFLNADSDDYVRFNDIDVVRAGLSISLSP